MEHLLSSRTVAKLGPHASSIFRCRPRTEGCVLAPEHIDSLRSRDTTILTIQLYSLVWYKSISSQEPFVIIEVLTERLKSCNGYVVPVLLGLAYRKLLENNFDPSSVIAFANLNRMVISRYPTTNPNNLHEILDNELKQYLQSSTLR